VQDINNVKKKIYIKNINREQINQQKNVKQVIKQAIEI